MEYIIQLLEKEKRKIDKHIRDSNLMRQDMKVATQELYKISELKKAIKILKLKK